MPVPRFYHYLGLSLQPVKNAIQLPDTVQQYQLRPMNLSLHQRTNPTLGPSAGVYSPQIDGAPELPAPTLSSRNKGGCTSPRSVRQRPATARARSCGARLHREGANLRTGGRALFVLGDYRPVHQRKQGKRETRHAGEWLGEKEQTGGIRVVPDVLPSKKSARGAFSKKEIRSPELRGNEIGPCTDDKWDNAAGGLGDDVEGRSESATDASIDQTTDPQVFAAPPIDTRVESVKKAETTPSTSERFRICVRPARLSSKKHWDSLVSKAG
ncbi:hypothetical protein B0H10DRAFT_2198225 [Mycena sp. CBHHK59/15]|nr:hypothetical protein B0H10DRAFT_2198225 [Mycena sp. CBHHK59/15]